MKQTTAPRFASISRLLLGVPTGFSEHDPRGTRFRSGDATLVYYEHGPRTGRPLVMVAGGPGFDHGYLRLGDPWKPLTRTQRMVFYDQRGTGHASPVALQDTVVVADYVADLEALRLALGAEEMDLLGHSFGGYLAMAYAVAHPSRVGRMILVDAAAPKPSETLFLFEQAYPDRIERFRTWSAALNRGDSAQAVELVDAYLSLLFHSPAKRDEWMRQAKAKRIGFNPHPARLLWNPAAGPDLTGALETLDLPTLVITGRHDMNVAALTAWKIHRAIKGSDFVVFESSGHLPFFEEPERFAKVLGDFLGRP